MPLPPLPPLPPPPLTLHPRSGPALSLRQVPRAGYVGGATDDCERRSHQLFVVLVCGGWGDAAEAEPGGPKQVEV